MTINIQESSGAIKQRFAAFTLISFLLIEGIIPKKSHVSVLPLLYSYVPPSPICSNAIKKNAVYG